MKKGITTALLTVLLALPSIGNTQAQNIASTENTARPVGLAGFDEFIDQSMKDWRVPGLAIAIVHGDRVVWQKGYGYRDVERRLPVTPDTLFSIGSITKSFTVTALGMEVDEGKLAWDRPVREYMPSFKLYDSSLTDQVTLRDMLTHRTGLPRHDLVWYTSHFSREEVIDRLQYLEPNRPLRSTFQYNNLMYLTAGYLAGKSAGVTWEEVVKRRILTPLRMDSTTFSYKDSQHSGNFALPYDNGGDLDVAVKRIPFDPQCPDRCAIGPAGGINSSVADMSRYLLMHLQHGKVGNEQLLSQSSALQMQTPQMVIQDAAPYAEISEISYGMGFFLSSYRGHKQVDHSGHIDGFSAQLGFLPNDGIGVVVLANLNGNELPEIVARNVFDRLLGLDPVPWNQRALDAKRADNASQHDAKRKGYGSHVTNTQPSHDRAEYLGDYENPGYGIVRIEADGSEFRMSLNQRAQPLKHYRYDVFAVPDDPLASDLANTKLVFAINKDGDIDSLSMPLEPTVIDIIFKRLPDRRMYERKFIEPFTGVYQIPGSTQLLTVALRGEHQLVTSVPGKPERALTPVRGSKFERAGLNSSTLEFKRDTNGRVSEAVLDQNGTIMLLKRVGI